MDHPRRVRSGTWLVVGMIGFGLLLTGGLYTYLSFHTAPFRSLAAALAERYPESAPRVDGGKPRLDRPGETVLRIVMKSPFDPADEDKANAFAREVAAFAAGHHDLSRFDTVEVHLFHGHPERDLSQRSIRLKVEDIAPDIANEPGGGV